MVLQLTIKSHISFSFIFYLFMSEWKHLIKVFQHLYIYTKFCFLFQASLTQGDLNSLTLSHWREWLKPVPSQMIFVKVPN